MGHPGGRYEDIMKEPWGSHELHNDTVTSQWILAREISIFRGDPIGTPMRISITGFMGSLWASFVASPPEDAGHLSLPSVVAHELGSCHGI